MVLFRDPADFEWYLGRLRKYAKQYGLLIIGYCIMNNHVHLVVVPLFKDSMAKVIGLTHGQFSERFRARHGGRGSVWTGRYWSEQIPSERLWVTMLYVEQNPPRANLCSSALDYSWSSARAHVEGVDPHDILDWTMFDQPQRRLQWSRELGVQLPKSVIQELRQDPRAIPPSLRTLTAVAHEQAVRLRLEIEQDGALPSVWREVGHQADD